MAKEVNGERVTSENPSQNRDMVSYFPTCEALTSALSLADKSLTGSRKVAIKASLLRHLITLALRSAPFDSETYIEQSPDIKKAVNKKEITNLKRHFEEMGYFEGRDAWLNDFDPQWYHSHYPDIKQNFDQTDTAGLIAHYKTNGQKELRAPNEQSLLEVEKWIKILKG